MPTMPSITTKIENKGCYTKYWSENISNGVKKISAFFLTSCNFLQMSALKNNVFVWNFREIFSVAHRNKQQKVFIFTLKPEKQPRIYKRQSSFIYKG